MPKLLIFLMRWIKIGVQVSVTSPDSTSAHIETSSNRVKHWNLNLDQVAEAHVPMGIMADNQLTLADHIASVAWS